MAFVHVLKINITKKMIILLMFAENTLFLEKIIAFVYNYIAKKVHC